MRRANLEKLGTMKLVVTRIYGQFAKAFIIVIVDGLGNSGTHALSFYQVFYTIHVIG
jgi:hypothetical protein